MAMKFNFEAEVQINIPGLSENLRSNQMLKK